MKIRADYIMGALLAIVLAAVDYYVFSDTAWFVPLLVVAVLMASLPFWIGFFIKLQQQRELEVRFPEFVRNLVGTIKSGMPAPRAILYVSNIDYGALTPYVKKLAHQVEWSIPVHKALLTFANDTRNTVIKRAISSVIEAEMSGGAIEDVLETVTNSVTQIKEIKQRRRAATHSQIVQSYVIFAVFLVVMIVIQNMLVPYLITLEGAQGANTLGIAAIRTGFSGMVRHVTVSYASLGDFFKTFGQWLVSLEGVFLMLALIQALFAGLVIGKLAEGAVIQGVKHSLILMVAAFFIITLAQGFL